MYKISYEEEKDIT